MRELGIDPPCVVFPERKARIDSSLRRWIGHDLFYFSSAQAMKIFDRDPLKYVRRLSDPVTSDRFRVRRNSLHAEYKERAYYFIADSTKAKFTANPSYWRDRRGLSGREEAGETP